MYSVSSFSFNLILLDQVLPSLNNVVYLFIKIEGDSVRRRKRVLLSLCFDLQGRENLFIITQ